MQANADLLAPMLKAQDMIEHDIKLLLEQVGQRRTSLTKLKDAIDVMRNLPEPIEQEVTKVTVKAAHFTPRDTSHKIDGNVVVDTAINYGKREFSTSQLIAIMIEQGKCPANTNYTRNQANKALTESGLFERLTFVGTAFWRVTEAVTTQCASN